MKKENEVVEDKNVENRSTENLINHDVKTVDPILLMKQSNENVCKLGATCAAKRIHEGSPIMDKATNQQKKNLTTGELMSYDNKYYVMLTFDGGEIEVEIDESKYNDVLEIGGRYSCVGRLAPVRVYGQTQILPVYHGFTKLY